MGQAALPLMIGASLFQFAGSMSAAGTASDEGAFQQQQYELEAQQEELGAISREADRKRQLAEAMASQTAKAGAGGIATFEGSPLTILNEDINKEQRDTQRDKFNTRMSALTKKVKGSDAKRAGQIKESQIKIGAVTGLAGGLFDAAKVA